MLTARGGSGSIFPSCTVGGGVQSHPSPQHSHTAARFKAFGHKAVCLCPSSLSFPEISPVIPVCVGNHLGIPRLLLISPLSLHDTFHLLPTPVFWAVALGPKGCFPAFSFKKPQQPNSLQSNHFMSDMEGTWGFMLAAAQRGIHGWSSSGRAGSGRHCQHSCCQSPGERSPEEHVSAGMGGSSAKSKGCFPP